MTGIAIYRLILYTKYKLYVIDWKFILVLTVQTKINLYRKTVYKDNVTSYFIRNKLYVIDWKFILVLILVLTVHTLQKN